MLESCKWCPLHFSFLLLGPVLMGFWGYIKVLFFSCPLPFTREVIWLSLPFVCLYGVLAADNFCFKAVAGKISELLNCCFVFHL